MDGTSTANSRIEAHGCEIELHRKGGGERILVLHGGKDLHGWHPYLDRLAERHDVIAPVHPGFGASTRAPEIETIDDLAYFYLDLIDDQEWSPVHLVGVGLGGWIAAEVAVKSCASLASLVLVDAVGIKLSGPDTPEIVDTYTMTEANRMARLWHDPERGRALLGDPKTMIEDDLERFLRNEEIETLYTWKPYMHDPALLRRLHRVRVPSLVLWGDGDGVVAPAYGQAFAAAIPSAKFSVIADSGHLPHLERPDPLAEAILSFLDQAGP